jgi:hypothetical protein
MNKIKIYCSWDLEIDLEHTSQIELYVDQLPGDPVPYGVIRFVYLLEPPEIMDLSQQVLSAHQNNTFNYLFTHNQALLDAIKDSYVMPLASTWIKDYQFPDKTFSVSTLVGGKRMAPGHHLRQKLWFKEDKITVPKNFFLSGSFGGIENYNNNQVLGSDKKPLFDSQFHICIENVKRRNWFTEKLIDCMVTKTVPIYYGCPNVEDWFDTRGFIIVDSLDDIISSCNALDGNTYNKMLPYVEENYKRGLELSDISVVLKNKILEIIN